MKKIRRVLSGLTLLFMMFAAMCTGGCAMAQKGGEESIRESIPESRSEAEIQELEVHFLDVGQGDCTLVICGGQAMLIDGGDNGQGTAVQLYLQKRGVKYLDYVIATHPDEDHIGGLDVVLTKFDCGSVLMPEVSRDTDTYRDVMDAMDYRGYVRTLPRVGNVYTLGDAEITIIAPNDNYEDTNNASIGVRLVHGENSFLFTGDAEAEAETDILENGEDVSADVLKIGHHGSSSSTSPDFLEAVNPSYAIISCGADNAYGHPSAQTLNTLGEKGISVFRTDEQGTLIAVSDGNDISFSCPPSDSRAVGDTKYILNIKSKKFHYPDCFGVETMTEKNKRYAELAREKIIENGYTPCGSCKP